MKRPRDQRPLRRGLACAAASLGLAAGAAIAGGGGQGPWRGIANNASQAPGTTQTFRSFNQPSVNRSGTVVFRARATGPGSPVRGIYLRQMSVDGAPLEVFAERGDEVPQPNNTETPPGSGQLADFLEFPAIPRIDAGSEVVATRAQHRPTWTYELGKGEETRVGTAGIYVGKGGVSQTAECLLGAVLDADTGLPVFPAYSVPGMPIGTRFDQFPGSPTVDRGVVAFKGNYTDPTTGVGKTGVFFRRVGVGPTQLSGRIASSDTLIPGQSRGGDVPFGSTASPSAADGWLVFLGLDDEEAPTMGGIYLAAIESDPVLLAIEEIGGAVPGVEGATFNRLGEALAFDGRFVSFWGAWGEETRTIILECPTDGNEDLIAYCHEQHPDGFAAEVPVHQGIFVHDLVTGETVAVATTEDEATGFTDFLSWVFSGRAPGVGGGGGGGGDEGGEGGEGEESEELARWRNSAFTAVTASGGAHGGVQGAGGGPPSNFVVAFKGSRGEVDGIYMMRGEGDRRLAAVLTTEMPGTIVDPEAPEGSKFVALGIEREGLRGDWLVVSASMLDEATKESWAGVYIASVADLEPCEGDLNGDAVVDGADLTVLLAAWGPCVGCAADLDQSGVVDGADLSILLGGWGTCW